MAKNLADAPIMGSSGFRPCWTISDVCHATPALRGSCCLPADCLKGVEKGISTNVGGVIFPSRGLANRAKQSAMSALWDVWRLLQVEKEVRQLGFGECPAWNWQVNRPSHPFMSVLSVGVHPLSQVEPGQRKANLVGAQDGSTSMRDGYKLAAGR